MTLQIVFCIAIFLYMIVMLAWNKYPMGVTALTSMALLILFKCIGPANALSSFGNANAVIIVGMFVVGAGLRKTSLVTTITNFIRKVTGGSFKTARHYCTCGYPDKHPDQSCRRLQHCVSYHGFHL